MNGSVRFSTRTLQATTTPAAASWPSSLGSGGHAVGAGVVGGAHQGDHHRAAQDALRLGVEGQEHRAPPPGPRPGWPARPGWAWGTRAASARAAGRSRRRGGPAAPPAASAEPSRRRRPGTPRARRGRSSGPTLPRHPGRDFGLWRVYTLQIPPSDVRGENCMTPNRLARWALALCAARTGRRVLRARRLRGTKKKDKDPTLKVMTRNIYLGGNIFLPIGAPDRRDVRGQDPGALEPDPVHQLPGPRQAAGQRGQEDQAGPDRPAGGRHLAPQPERRQGRVGHALAPRWSTTS